MDFEELAAWMAVRNSMANHPCPKCLVHHCDLHKITAKFKLRTPSTMKAVVSRAREEPNKTAANKHLQNAGLHDIEVHIL